MQARKPQNTSDLFSFLLYALLAYEFISFTVFTGNFSCPSQDGAFTSFLRRWALFLFSPFSVDDCNYHNYYQMIPLGEQPVSTGTVQTPKVPVLLPEDIWKNIIIDVGLLCIWFLQHSLFARYQVMNLIARNIGKHQERALYVIGSGIMMFLMFYFWHPISSVVIWRLGGMTSRFFSALYILSVGLMVASLFSAVYYDQFDIREAFTGIRKPSTEPSGIMRHPLFFTTLATFWTAPIDMTLGRFIFCLAMTLYTLVGMRLQDIDYQEKTRRVPLEKKEPSDIRREEPAVVSPGRVQRRRT